MDHKDQLLLEEHQQEILLFVSLPDIFLRLFHKHHNQKSLKKNAEFAHPIMFDLTHGICVLTAMCLYVLLIALKTIIQKKTTNDFLSYKRDFFQKINKTIFKYFL